MTKISEIHGIPANEFHDRGRMVATLNYVPYLSLTTGEMELYLAAQRAKIRAQFYGSDAPQYAQAYQMIENALHAGVHGGIRWMGAVPDYLQSVAAMIKQAERQTRPASKTGLLLRGGQVNGIGQTTIPIEQRKQACIEAAWKKAKIDKLKGAQKKIVEDYIKGKCNRQFNIEKIFNDAIENTGHHVLYHRISQNNEMPERVFTKLLLHTSGVQGMAGAGDVQTTLMGSWVETGIVGKNAAIGVGPIDSIKAAVQLSNDPDGYYQRFYGDIAASQQKKKDKMNPTLNGIGIIPAVAIIGAIAGALGAAAALINSLRGQQALIKAEAFGTDAFSAAETDWTKGANNPEVSGGLSPMTILLLGGAALLLLSDDK